MSDVKKSVQKTFSAASENYVKSELHAKGEDLKALVNELEGQGYERLLDIAVGAGHVSNAAAPHVKEVIGVDLTEEMLETSRNFIKKNGHENVSFHQDDAESLTFEEDAFDVSVCRIAAHHFEHPDRFLQSAFRITKTNGYFYLLDNTAPEDASFDAFYNDVEKRRDDSHYRAWKKSEWIAMVEAAGFTVERVERFKKTFQFDDWCDRLNLPHSTREELQQLLKNAEEDFQKKFNMVKKEDGNIFSFDGESILLRAKK